MYQSCIGGESKEAMAAFNEELADILAQEEATVMAGVSEEAWPANTGDYTYIRRYCAGNNGDTRLRITTAHMVTMFLLIHGSCRQN